MKSICQHCGCKFNIYKGELWRTECEPCIEKIETKRQMDESIRVIGEALNPENAAKFKAMPREDQELVAMHAWNDGIIKWKFNYKEKA